ncbi:MAG: hypothetical protein AB7O63_08050 [Reyranellaceae bacterium]
MISLGDCVALCGLSEEEILAIAEHEQLPEIEAAALAQYLLRGRDGTRVIREMIVDDIRAAQGAGDRARVQSLLHVLHHYLRQHPEARPPQHPWSRVF